MAGHVQIRGQQPNLRSANTRRALIVHLQAKSKWLLVHDPNVQDAFTRGGARFELGVDLFYVWVLPNQLQALLQLVQVQRWDRPPLQTPRDIAVTQPLVAMHLRTG